MSEEQKPDQVGSEASPDPDGLTDQERKFVEAYALEPNATAAARAAGYKQPHVLGTRLLKRVRVAVAIARRLGAAAAPGEAPLRNAERYAEEIDRLAFMDPAELFDEAGRLRPVREMPPAVRCCIASIEMKRVGVDDPVEVIKVRLANSKLPALKYMLERVERPAGGAGASPATSQDNPPVFDVFAKLAENEAAFLAAARREAGQPGPGNSPQEPVDPGEGAPGPDAQAA